MFLNVPRFEPTPTGRFKTIMWLLGAAILDQGKAQFVAMPLLLIAAARLQALTRRFAATLARTPRRVGERSATHRSADPCPAPTTQPKPRKPNPLPRARGWLRRLVPNHWVNGHIAEFQRFLETDEMRDIYQTHPTIGRTIRPLCHMMGIPTPEILRLPKPEPTIKRKMGERSDTHRPAHSSPSTPNHSPSPQPERGNHYVTILAGNPQKPI